MSFIKKRVKEAWLDIGLLIKFGAPIIGFTALFWSVYSFFFTPEIGRALEAVRFVIEKNNLSLLKFTLGVLIIGIVTSRYNFSAGKVIVYYAYIMLFTNLLILLTALDGANNFMTMITSLAFALLLLATTIFMVTLTIGVKPANKK